MNFKDKNILVIGDSILDETIVGEAVGLSLESPTLKVQEKNKIVSFGGAANVVENILELGASCTYITPVGHDEYKYHYDMWSSDNNHLRLSIISMDRFNNVKTRIWATRGGESYKCLQVNRTDATEVPDRIPTLNYHLMDKSAVLLVDYGLGMFGEVDYIIEAAQEKGIPVIASSQLSDRESRYDLFFKADYLCMNQKEAKAYGKQFNGCKTKGDKGCTFYDKGIARMHKGYAVDCVDPCGAGDSFLAALSLFIDNVDADALSFCNAWAALSTTKLGTTPPDLGDINELLKRSFC